MIKVFQPDLRIQDSAAVLRTLARKNISGTSRAVSEFEIDFAKLCGRKHAVMVTNGTVALDLAFESLNLLPGDEVIVPSFTIISCIHWLLNGKVKIVFVDVDPLTWNMRVEEVESAITTKTRCVLIVHTYGLPADAIKISDLCRDKKITVIEDAAEAHGQEILGKKCGSFGEMSTFSFYANKHITTGEGGVVLTDDSSLYNKLCLMRNLGFSNQRRFVHSVNYGNYRMSGLQASLGISHMRRLSKTIRAKQKQGSYYNKLFRNHLNLVQLPADANLGSKNHYWVFGIKLQFEGIRDRLLKELAHEGIETRPFFWPLHLQPILNIKDGIYSLPVSEDLGRNGFYIPMGKHVKRRHQRQIVKKIIFQVESLSNSENQM
jgi:perosamine synthetase